MDAKRFLSNNNYLIQTDAVKNYLIPSGNYKENLEWLAYAEEADEVFMRVGDKSKKLTFEERMQLLYDKGERFFEDKPVPEADLEDFDLRFVKNYIDQIGYSKTPMEYLRENKGFIFGYSNKRENIFRERRTICNGRGISEICPSGNYCKFCYTS